MQANRCSEVICVHQAVKRGMCDRHYRAALRTGKISPKRAVGLTIRDRLNFHSLHVPGTDCLEWTGSRHKDTGYGNITINRKTVSAHRAAWESANGKILAGLHVLHKCDNRACINPDHLFLGTNDDNVADMVAKGRNVVVRGERRANSKLTDELVKEIRADNRPHRAIASDLGVGHTIIGMVKQNKIWRHVD